MFNAIEEGIKKHYNQIYRSTALIADAAQAIVNAKVFGNSPEWSAIMCFAHVMPTLEKLTSYYYTCDHLPFALVHHTQVSLNNN